MRVSAVDAVEAEVRELVRRRGLDPVADRAAMRRLVDEVVTEYDERALTSSLPSLPDLGAAGRAVYDAVAGFAPLQRHLDAPTIEEIWINERLTGGFQPTRCGRIAVALPVGSWLDQPAAQVRTARVTPTIAAAAVSLPTTFSGDPADRPIYASAWSRVVVGQPRPAACARTVTPARSPPGRGWTWRVATVGRCAGGDGA